MKMGYLLILFSLVFVLTAGCGNDDDLGTGGDSDTDSDGDTDSDSDTDSDTGTGQDYDGILTQQLEISDHGGTVYSLDWTPDDTTLISAGYQQIGLWNADTGAEVNTLTGHENFVWGVACSPDGNNVASASQDGTVRLWNMSNYEEDLSIETAWAFCVDWSDGGTRIVSGNDFDQVQVWDVATGDLMLTYSIGDSLYDGYIISVDWSPDGEKIAAGYWSGKIAIIDAASGDQLALFENYTKDRCDTNGIAWSPDGQTVASAHQDGKVRLWDVESEQLDRTITGHQGWVRGIAWSPNGTILASTGEDRSVRLWGPPTGLLLAMEIEHTTPVWSVAWSQDGSQLATGSGNYNSTETTGNSIIVWSVE